jgi:hypothetical protein
MTKGKTRSSHVSSSEATVALDVGSFCRLAGIGRMQVPECFLACSASQPNTQTLIAGWLSRAGSALLMRRGQDTCRDKQGWNVKARILDPGLRHGEGWGGAVWCGVVVFCKVPRVHPPESDMQHCRGRGRIQVQDLRP